MNVDSLLSACEGKLQDDRVSVYIVGLKGKLKDSLSGGAGKELSC